MNDFLPPRRPQQSQPPSSSATSPTQEPEPVQLEKSKPLRSHKRTILAVLIGLLLVLVTGSIAAVVFYSSSLRPVDSASTAKQTIAIKPGSTPAQIGAQLKQDNLIRSQQAFELYTRLSGTRGQLQAGAYRLSPSESTQEIVKHMASGHVDTFSLTFYPGATLSDTTDSPKNKGTAVMNVLLEAGYSKEEITEAFSAEYDSPLFADKPAGADLEGYIYGETYNFSGDATVKEILQRTFDEMYAQIKKYSLEKSYKKQGLSLFEGITLASMVQREVSGKADQAHVAQVFFTRLKKDMPLGSDVTYQYAARKLGVTPSPNLDSPYNTRRFPGIPPGPIATPGLSALRAVATPTDTNDLYFVSGDDDINYFSKTNKEHEANVKKHCAVKCSIY